jgi:response regulator RpfG family c-di-GMP phosphodiesterase
VLKALEQKVYDLMFLDVQMPEMDGLEAARQICKRWSPERRPAIIAMTGNALMGDREKCLAAGMDDYISKPVRIAELQAALERWGPLKTAHFDTKILLRTKAISPEELLEPGLVARLDPKSGGNPNDVLRQRIEQFLTEAPQYLNQLAHNGSEAKALADDAHALKLMSAAAGAKRITELCQKLEELGRIGTLESVPAVMQELRAAFALTRIQLAPLVATSPFESTP